MKQNKEPSLIVIMKTVGFSVSLKIFAAILFGRVLTQVSFVDFNYTDVPETNRLFVELGHMLEYHLGTAHWMANHPSVHSGPLHMYPDIFESATTPFRFKNFHIHTYPDLL